MNAKIALGAAAALVLFTAAGPVRADYDDSARDDYPSRVAPQPQSLEDLVASIALYPDPLLAQMLPAATFPDQIRDAARDVDEGRSLDYGRYDDSVYALSHYPSVLQMMADRIDWTTDLGNAYLDNRDALMDAVQHLRFDAYDDGALRSNSQIEVVREDGEIRIWPAQAEVMYVPRYDPVVVYRRGPSTGERIFENLISFGAGIAIGSWLNNDCDWRGHRVYHHGWEGGGWVGRSRNRLHLDLRFVGNNWRSRPVAVNPHPVRRFDGGNNDRRLDGGNNGRRFDGGNNGRRFDGGNNGRFDNGNRSRLDDGNNGRRTDRPTVQPDRSPGNRDRFNNNNNDDRTFRRNHDGRDRATVEPQPARRNGDNNDRPSRPVVTPQPPVRNVDPGRGNDRRTNADPDRGRLNLGDYFRLGNRQNDRTQTDRTAPARQNPPSDRPSRDTSTVRDRTNNDRGSSIRGSSDRSNRSNDRSSNRSADRAGDRTWGGRR